MIANVVFDLKMSITRPQYMSGDREEIKKIVEAKLPPIMKFRGEHKFLTGDSPAWIDFLFFELVENLEFVSEGKLLAEHPKVKEYHSNVASLPKLAEYIASGAEKKLPFNNKMAKLGATA
mmetsp:Transcript_6229/g.4412  ORF Transcript_6229/g.4412 Transcript_6229/m.4412 type:complete len:120 (+) Transcript_6229:340-699(+)